MSSRELVSLLWLLAVAAPVAATVSGCSLGVSESEVMGKKPSTAQGTGGATTNKVSNGGTESKGTGAGGNPSIRVTNRGTGGSPAQNSGQGSRASSGSSAYASGDGVVGGARPDSLGSSTSESTNPKACPRRASITEAVHIQLDVTWPATAATSAGSGKAHLFSLERITYDGDSYVAATRACGSTLPDSSFTVAGQLATGGEKMLIEIPDSVWDSPSAAAATSQSQGKQSSPDIDATIENDSITLVGLTMPNPRGSWPASGSDVAATDYDGDGRPGFTAVARSGGGYVLPSTTLGILGSAPAADKIYLVNRESIKLSGKRTACDAHSGIAKVTAFDNHVVGCHVFGGGECDADQSGFIDDNRMFYQVKSATYEAYEVIDSASCADVVALFSS